MARRAKAAVTDAERAVLVRVGNRVREIREARGQSQDELAEQAGIHRTHVSLIEHGYIDPGIVTLLRVAGGLECSLSALVDEDVE